MTNNVFPPLRKFALGAWLAVSLSLPCTTGAQIFSAADYMPLNPGDSWIMRVNSFGQETWIVAAATVPINGTNARQIVWLPGSGFEYHTNDGLGLRWHGRLEDSVVPAVLVTLTPFKHANSAFLVGDLVINSGSIFLNGVPAGSYSGSSQVVAVEQVSVPAGVFRAVRFRRSVSATINSQPYSETSDFWLAQGVGVIKLNRNTTLSGFDSFELLSSNRLPALASSVLPVSRSAVVGSPVTAFATMINAGPSPATGCSVTLPTGAPAGLSLLYQATDPATNQVVGTPNTPVNLASGASQSFVLALTASAPFPAVDLPLSFDCVNSPPGSMLLGINTLLVSASTTPVPDVIALAATLTNDGIVNIPGASGTGAFAVASVNVGAGGSITVTADTGGAAVPVSLSLCQTDPGSGVCLAPPAGSVTTAIANGATPTFGVFVSGTGSAVAFNPAANRVFVRFRDGGGVVRGATSVAVRTQ